MTVVQNCDLVVTFSIPTNQPCPSFSRFATMLIIHLSKRTMPILFFYILPCWLKGTTYPPSLILCGLKDYTHFLHSSMLTEQQCPSSSSFVHWKQPFPFSSFFLVDLKQMFYPLYSWLEISCWLKKKLSIVQSFSLTEDDHFQSLVTEDYHFQSKLTEENHLLKAYIFTEDNNVHLLQSSLLTEDNVLQSSLLTKDNVHPLHSSLLVENKNVHPLHSWLKTTMMTEDLVDWKWPCPSSLFLTEDHHAHPLLSWLKLTMPILLVLDWRLPYPSS